MTQQKTGPVVKQVDITKMVFKNFVMGGTAGIIGATSCYPLDIIKTRLQSQTIIPGQEPMYKGVGDAFKKILARDGVRGLYRGLPAQLVGITPEKAIKLSANDLLRYLFTNKETGEIKVWQEMVSGSLAGFSQVIVTNPYELVKVRLQTASTLPGAERKTIMSVVKEVGGVSGLFRGAGACLLRDVPFSAVYFTLFGNFKRMASDENGHITLLWSFACGCFAGTISAATVTPADVVKTRLQVAGSEAKYKGIADCFSKILKEEGPRALFKGAIPRVMIISPLFGITLATYEFMKGLFE